MIGFWGKLRYMIRISAPGMLALFLVVVTSVNYQNAAFTKMPPFIMTMAVFYWGLYWPISMPRWFVFLLGMFHDAMHGMPIGVSSLVLILVVTILNAQRRHLIKENFYVSWLAFVLTVSIVAAYHWFMHSIYFGILFWSDTIWMQLLVTFLFYPVVHKLFNLLHNAMISER